MERIVFTLSYEKRWDCWMVHADRVVDAGDFFQPAGRYRGNGEDTNLPLPAREVLPLIANCDTPALFRRFGRKRYKDERDFLQRVEDKYVQEDIRPHLERQAATILDTLADIGFPLFLKNSRLDNLYEKQRLVLKPTAARAALRFERTERFTRYILRIAEGDHTFYPSDYDLKILTRRPCRVLSGRYLFRFPEDFDGQRLLPFLQKREIQIPKANERLYFRKFILKNIRHEELEVQGFDVIVHAAEKRAILSLEREVFGMPVLVLEFRYGKHHIPYWSERKALVELHTDGDNYAFYKTNREREWEEQQATALASLGLRPRTPGNFRVEGITEPTDEDTARNEACEDTPPVREAWVRTLDWVTTHTDKLKELGIAFTQKSLRHPYYTAGWEVKLSVQTETDWFELRAEVVLADGRRIPLLRFRDHLLAGRREFLLEDGTVFIIPEEWFAKYTDILLFAGSKGQSLFLHRNQYALLGQSGAPASLPRAENAEAPLPADLRATLRPYQQAGYEWLYRLYRAGLGGCLADDMGLGKTLQIIALLLKYRQEGTKPAAVRLPSAEPLQLSLFDAPETETQTQTETAAPGAGHPPFHTCLIVVPASLVHNWRKELRRFAPQLTVTVYAGQNRAGLRPYLQRSDVALVTYHTLRNDIDYLARLTFGIVVADEAQAIKNPDSQIHQAVMRLRGKWFYALSGTPVENSLSDLWAVLHFTNRNMLGSHAFFRKHFIKPILSDIEGRMNAALRKLIAPYILRRTKEEVLAELPELTSGLVLCEPTEEQHRIYEEEQSRVRNYLMGRNVQQGSLRSDFMVLKALIRLRQIANHPRLVDPGYEGSSGKFREVFRMLDDILAAGHKVLIFSSFVKYLQLVEEEVSRRQWAYAMLTGGTADREQEIHRFATRPGCRLFLISLKAGGVGLNLTEADYVFILDPWWNLAAEQQAVSRAHRMGQKRAVFVYRFITEGTLEDKILAIQQRKQQLADAVITATPLSSPVPLSDDELMEALR